MKRYLCNKGNNENYWMHISCPGHGFEVVCDLPEQIHIGVTSDWESRLPFTLTGILDNVTLGMADKLGDIAGVNPQNQSLSYQMWMGNSPIEIPLNLLFDSYKSAKDDVFEPIQMLLAAAQPINSYNDMLTPPGPKWGGGWGGIGSGYGINIKFGRGIMFFQHCILVSANETLDTRLDREGYPISGQVECTFRTSYIYGHNDWLDAMKLPQLG